MGEYFHTRFVFSLLFTYLIFYLYQSGSWGLILYFGYNPNIIFFAKIILALAKEYYFIWFLCPFDISPLLCFFTLFLNYIFYWILNLGLDIPCTPPPKYFHDAVILSFAFHYFYC